MRAYDPFVPLLATKAGVFSSVGSIKEALAGAECAFFLIDHDAFREISIKNIKRLMASPVIVDGKICSLARKMESCIRQLGKVRCCHDPERILYF